MIMNKYKNSFFLLILIFLTSCLVKEQKPERLLPPEPVLIKEDMTTKKTNEPQKDKGQETMPPQTEQETMPSQTEEEARQPLPSWAKSKGDGVYKLGKPYKVNGVWYFPAENARYDEIGFAGRYPKSFQGQRTANGEIYSKDLLTACHKTLPLPSVVQMTNLSNNKSIVLRINDRGPFVNDRLIDISDKAATLLEFPEEGPVKVRVEILNQESKTAASALHQAEKSVLPAAAYPPAIAKEPAAQAPAQNNQAFVTMEAAPSPEVFSDDSLFDEMPGSQSAQNQAPSAPPPPLVSPPAPLTPPMAPVEQVSVPRKQYYIQAGVFGNPNNAKKLKEKLGSVGLVESVPVTLNGRSLHSVRVGPFSSSEEANRALKQVRSDVPDARLINP